MTIRRYSRSDIEKLLQAIDRHLKRRYEIVVIGGASVTLAYSDQEYTIDIDTTGGIDDIRGAYEAAKKETGLAIPMGPAGIYDGPYAYEDRLIELKKTKCRRLRVLVPEVHDLILMKTTRGNAHDLQQIKGVAKNQSISLDVLVDRYRKEMTHVIGNSRTLRLNFLAMVAEIFGEKAADGVEQALGE